MSIPLYCYDFLDGSFETFKETDAPLCHLVKQVHGRDIFHLTPDMASQQELAIADGIVVFYSDWGEKRPLIGIKTADCLPLLILGKKGVAMLHAGHRGVAQKIEEESIIAQIHPHTLFVGPSIHSCCYQVGEEFCDHFTMIEKRESGLYLDLPREVMERFKKNYPSSQVIDSGKCTCCDLHFESYRRNKTLLRQINIWRPL